MTGPPSYPPMDPRMAEAYPGESTHLAADYVGRGAHRIRRHEEPRRKLSPAVLTLIGVLLALLAAGIVAAHQLGRPDPGTTPAGAPIVPPTTSATPAAVPPVGDLPEGAFTGDSDQAFVVGDVRQGAAVPPGKYTTAGSLNDAEGTWVRSRFQSSAQDPPGEFAPVADGSSRGPLTVTLRAGDLFSTHNFKPWNRVQDAAPTPVPVTPTRSVTR